METYSARKNERGMENEQLYKSRVTQQLADVHAYNPDVTVLQGMRWIRTGILDKRDLNICYSCYPNHYELRASF